MSKIFATVTPTSLALREAVLRTAADRAARYRSVFEAPRDLERRRVLADWLIEQGDPHGEFIAVQFEHTRKARLRAGKLLHRHRAHFLGPLSPWVEARDDERWEQGFLKHGALRWSAVLAHEPALATLRSLRLVATDGSTVESRWLHEVVVTPAARASFWA
jgi:uncharacterized protein (TIGR02996 family)